jgi:trk system potassium uptake protein
MKSYIPVFRVLGVTVMVFSAMMLVPLAVSVAQADRALSAYPPAIAITLGVGALIWLLTKNDHSELQPHHGVLLVTLAWSGLPVFATLPLLLHFHHAGAPISFTNAYFESLSGLTTTGATVLVGLDALPPSINVWRCFLQWLGGGGILVLMVAILPLVGVGGSQVFRAEASGPMKDTKLTPRMAETAKGLWKVYFVASLACFAAYWAAGMPALDALIHMFTTISSGGFSSHDASFGHFKSPQLEWIAVFFMIFTSCSYAVFFAAIYRRDPLHILKDAQLRGTVGLLVGSSLLVALVLIAKGTYSDPMLALRMAFFHVASIGSTTGYATTDYGLWPIFVPILLLLLSGLSSSAGSTGAGVKMIRLVIVLKHTRREMKRIVHPRMVSPVTVGREVVSPETSFAILGFLLVYGASTILLTLLLVLTDMKFDTALSAVIATINTTGPGLNEIGPAGNFGALSDYQKWILILSMLLGRLELLPVFMLFMPSFWRR